MEMIGGPKEIKKLFYVLVLAFLISNIWNGGKNLVYIENLLSEFLSKVEDEVLSNLPEKPFTEAEKSNMAGLDKMYLENDYPAAESLFRQAISQSPTFSAPYNNLGISLDNQGKYDEAIESYLKAIEINPNYAKAYNNLGVSYKNKLFTGDGEENRIKARDSYIKAIELDDSESNPWANLGWLYMYNTYNDNDSIKAKYYYEGALSRGSAIQFVNEGLRILKESGY